MMVTIAHAGEEVESDTLAVGTVITVRSGDCVAVDGVVTRGATAVDESMLTGEAAPVAKGVGDAVSGGTLNVGGSTLEVHVQSVPLSSLQGGSCTPCQSAAFQPIVTAVRDVFANMQHDTAYRPENPTE